MLSDSEASGATTPPGGPRFFAALRMTCPGHFFMACHDTSGDASYSNLIAAIVIAAAVTPRAVGEQVPESHQDDRAHQRAQQGNTGHIDIPDAVDNEQMCHQPDADERSNDCPDDAKRQSPANDVFRDHTNNCCNNQVNDETRADRENSVTKGE